MFFIITQKNNSIKTNIHTTYQENTKNIHVSLNTPHFNASADSQKSAKAKDGV
jgi:hypothetical protein